jgi:hypothetical protein
MDKGINKYKDTSSNAHGIRIATLACTVAYHSAFILQK